ncbi:hypothetical protein AB6735_22140 [Mucilaginibacter sp. RCC_168]|uniref:hypothetical protein n=1 Tax=Mucilaginibacter sp. RCC_168 TaxID=3239221 RepID=UPI003523DFFB
MNCQPGYRCRAGHPKGLVQFLPVRMAPLGDYSGILRSRYSGKRGPEATALLNLLLFRYKGMWKGKIVEQISFKH